ncbi:hypothetical protein O181_121036 [Austropuccinia psidii MF-1]|uniref:Uncharacterized protein n=1 Tax=Austropuccinia psidii MF-1 TaxID=1389203 RepID=A0A9Q3KJL3_9BASI|nr:hypothetical protein [Austropuccinia psidii MF-1]
MAPTEIFDINKTYDGFKSVRVIEPSCINCQNKWVSCVESATARSTRCQFCILGKINCSQANHRFIEKPRRLWSSIQKGGRFGLEAPVDEPQTSDATSGHSNYELKGKGISGLPTLMDFFLFASVTGSRMRGFQQWIIPTVPEPKLDDPFTPKATPLEWP